MVTRNWWILDGFEIDAAGQRGNAIRFQTDAALGFNARYCLARNIHAHHGSGSGAIAFMGARDAALLNSRVHEYTQKDASGAPKDSHGIYVLPDSARILIRGCDSWGNSGDSVQLMGADHVPGTYHPQDVTIENCRFGNRFPDGSLRLADRENAVDLKSCSRVTVRNCKMMGYRATNTAPIGVALVAHYKADKILVERCRFWDSGMAASLGSEINTGLGSVVFRRCLIFNMVTASGGIGSGIRVGPARVAEVYFNTFYALPSDAAPTRSNFAISMGYEGLVGRAVIVNNIVAHTGTGVRLNTLRPEYTPDLSIARNLFYNVQAGVPAGSLVTNPQFVNDPVNNDFYTLAGSPARDVAMFAPTAQPYHGNGPDIGFLESP
jgi:hypothetical protein